MESASSLTRGRTLQVPSTSGAVRRGSGGKQRRYQGLFSRLCCSDHCDKQQPERLREIVKEDYLRAHMDRLTRHKGANYETPIDHGVGKQDEPTVPSAFLELATRLGTTDASCWIFAYRVN